MKACFYFRGDEVLHPRSGDNLTVRERETASSLRGDEVLHPRSGDNMIARVKVCGQTPRRRMLHELKVFSIAHTVAHRAVLSYNNGYGYCGHFLVVVWCRLVGGYSACYRAADRIV